MNAFSQMNNIPGIANGSAGVWKIEKKRKARDNKQRSGRNKRMKKEDEKEQDTLRADKNDSETCEEEIGYGPQKTNKNRCLKIDLKI